MAGNSNQGSRSVSATLQASTVDLVWLTDPGFGVSVENISGSSPIYWTVSRQGGPCPVPSVAASTGTVNTFCTAASPGAVTSVRHAGQFGSIVQLISSGTPSYNVSIVGNQING